MEVKEPGDVEDLSREPATLTPTEPSPELSVTETSAADATAPSPELLSAFQTEVVDEPSASRVVPTKITTKDLRIIRQLGTGSQGSVFKVEFRTTSALYALKMIPKHTIRRFDTRVHEEQAVLRSVVGDARFLQLMASFEDEDYFFLMTVRHPFT